MNTDNNKVENPEGLELNNERYGVKSVTHLYEKNETKGCVSISRFTVTPTSEPHFNIRYSNDPESPDYIHSGDYVRLMIDGEITMSDTQFERVSNKGVIDYSNGHVLIGGLGIGLIIHNLLEKENIKSITVIEINQDVIDLVSPKFNDERLTIIHDDIWKWRPSKGQKFDSIYFDIWSSPTFDIIPEVEQLYKEFRKYLNYKNFDWYINGWMYDSILNLKKRKTTVITLFLNWKGFLTDPWEYNLFI